MKASIVFLDFDGVTHPEVCKVEQLFNCLHLIEGVLRHHLRVEVVISSSWREYHPLSELRARFSRDIGDRAVGCTPVAPIDRAQPAPSHVRELECRTWLTLHRPDHPRIAIDDVPWLFQPGCPNLMLTNHRTGFSRNNAEFLHSLFERLST